MTGTQHSVSFFTTFSKYFCQLFFALENQMKISFLSEMVLEDLREIKNLFKSFLIQISMKKSGNKLFCHIVFKYLVSLCKIG